MAIIITTIENVIYYNLHNYDLTACDVARLKVLVQRELDFARNDPTNRVVYALGDFNIVLKGEFPIRLQTPSAGFIQYSK